ncbi:hypothetical protein [Ascidiaceihabitans sp.]|uniref:hypothetical protein n=1 Tax=Ascidiaceihabitans sp. TaxID=1872644 RepID=UPI0032995B6E
MSDDIGWKPVWEINLNFLRASVGFSLGWLMWQAYSPEWFYFGFVSVLCWIGGAKRLIQALWGLMRLLLRKRKLSRYRRQGTTPKADKLAQENDLRARGIIE